jgi:hypothetical protein
MRSSAKFTPNTVASLVIVVLTYSVALQSWQSIIRSPREVSP